MISSEMIIYSAIFIAFVVLFIRLFSKHKGHFTGTSWIYLISLFLGYVCYFFSILFAQTDLGDGVYVLIMSIATFTLATGTAYITLKDLTGNIVDTIEYVLISMPFGVVVLPVFVPIISEFEVVFYYIFPITIILAVYFIFKYNRHFKLWEKDFYQDYVVELNTIYKKLEFLTVFLFFAVIGNIFTYFVPVYFNIFNHLIQTVFLIINIVLIIKIGGKKK